MLNSMAVKFLKSLCAFLSISYYSFAQLSLSDSLKAYYPFNGNALDESGNNNNGIVNGANLIPDRFLNPNSAYSFNGMDDYIEFPNDFDYPERSILIWFYVRTFPSFGGGLIFSSSNPSLQYGQTVISVRDLNGDFIFGMGSGGGPSGMQSVIIEQNKWYMLALTENLDSNYYYLNDSLLEVKPTGFLTSPSIVNGSTIGCSIFLDNFFDGIIDDIAIYNRKLDSSEVFAIYNGATILSGIEEDVVSNNISVYPNPASDYLNIQLQSLETESEFVIQSLDGSVMHRSILNKQNNQIEVGSFPAGIYFYFLENVNSAFSGKFIKSE